MKEITHLRTISDLYKLFGFDYDHHPLVAVLDFKKLSKHESQFTKITTDFYTVIFKNHKNHIKYGRKTNDFQEGNLICIAPNRVIQKEGETANNEDNSGWVLFFHPDLIRATPLNDKIKEYSFFSYEMTKALLLSEKEKRILLDCVQRIQAELNDNIDIHSQHIVIVTIELLLNYCSRFYGRKIITRSQNNRIIISEIENILNRYFADMKIKEHGLPTVKYLADSVNLSSSYLSDLLKKETGKNAQEQIHFYLIEEAKNRLINTDQTINEIAYNLGFAYPQYFHKLFKQKTGKTPATFRNLT